MKKVSGYLLIGLGVLHTLVGLAAGWDQVKKIISYGVWNALGKQSQIHCMKNIGCLQVNSIWWFISWGLMLILFGILCTWIEVSLKKAIPTFIAWLLLLISSICAILIPASGFWLVIAVAIYMLFSAKSEGNKKC